MKTGKVFLSILLAAAAGVAVGILYAPEKGVRTRKRFREQSEDYLQELEDLKNEYERSLHNLKRKVVSAYDDIESKIKDRIEEKGKSGQDLQNID